MVYGNRRSNNPGSLKPFKWKVPKAAGKPVRDNIIEVEPEEEALTGLVRGQKASDIEERLYLALAAKFGWQNVEFQPSYIGVRNVDEVRPDFAIHGLPRMIVVYADDEFTHGTAEAKQHDKVQDARLMQKLGNMIEPPVRILGNELRTKELARQAVEQRW